MPRVSRRPLFWLTTVLVWFGVLWVLSSGVHPEVAMPPIYGFDKVAHFGYFFGGAGLFAAFLFRMDPVSPRWRRIVALTVVMMGLVGWIDEYHQGFVPGRTGNDPFDWLADVIGGFCGALVFKAFHGRLKWDS